MNHLSAKSLVLCCAILGCLLVLDAGTLTPQAAAQQRDGDEGDRPREGRGGWRRFRRNGGGNEEGRGDRRRDRDRDNDNDNEDRGSEERGSEERDNDERSSFDVAEYARTRVRELDKNGNKVIDGDELRQLRGPAAGADLNNDKFITVEELIARLSEREGANARRGPGGAGNQTPGAAKETSGKSTTGTPSRVYTGTAAGGAAKDDKAEARRSYRFTPGNERTTTGLPSWFKSRDRNRDGQVAMSEYSRLWSRRMVSEFRRYDANDDGVITPKEAAD